MFSISNRHYRCIVDHLNRWAVESDESTQWQWRTVPFDDQVFVSHMTRLFAEDILSRGQCDLPTLQASLVAHRFILDALKPHFSQLMEHEVVACPVT